MRNRISEVIRERGYSCADVARLANLSYSVVRGLLRPDRDPPLAHALRVAAVLDLAVEDLFEIDRPTPPFRRARAKDAGEEPRLPSVAYAILGMLREEPAHGYQLKRSFEARMGDLWGLNSGHVYQVLGALQRGALIREIDPPESADRRQRRFTTTAKGVRTLERWLAKPATQPGFFRDPIFVKLMLLGPDSCEACAQLDDERARFERQLDRFRAMKAGESAPAAELRSLVLEAALLHAEARLRWVEFCRARQARSRAALDSSLAGGLAAGPTGAR